MLDKEFQYFLSHQEELASEHPGKFVVIVGEQVISLYASEKEAYEESMKKFRPGTFLIQKCEPGKDNYSQTFNSRVVF